jgi:hypothetical protein
VRDKRVGPGMSALSTEPAISSAFPSAGYLCCK